MFTNTQGREERVGDDRFVPHALTSGAQCVGEPHHQWLPGWSSRTKKDVAAFKIDTSSRSGWFFAVNRRFLGRLSIGLLVAVTRVDIGLHHLPTERLRTRHRVGRARRLTPP